MSYKKNSLSVAGAVAMGTGVMIGAGIFALTGQVAELAKSWFPVAFLIAAAITGFSSYSYIKMSNAYPSAGGIAMFLEKAYGKGLVTAVCALLMYFSMVINESLVARTFGTYVTQLFDVQGHNWLVPMLGVLLLIAAFLVNILSNRTIEKLSFWMAFLKIGGLCFLAFGGLWVADYSFEDVSRKSIRVSFVDFSGAVALALLAFKGFTTITNSGAEIVKPSKNIGRSIVISISICLFVYMLVALAVGGNLSIEEIVRAKDYVLAEAARPAFGVYGVRITVLFAIVATVSGVIASVFAVSRMLAMLTDMKLVPHSHFGMPGDIQKHTLVYTVCMAILLTIFFDLGRIASLGAIFYIVMDMAVHWGVLKYLRKSIDVNPFVVIMALLLDVFVLISFLIVKIQNDAFVVWVSLLGIMIIVLGEYIFLKKNKN